MISISHAYSARFDPFNNLFVLDHTRDRVMVYLAAPLTISGNAGLAGAALGYTDGVAKTALADGSGNYSFTVRSGWSGTVTPSLTGYGFTPAGRSYTNVKSDQTGQDYVAHPTVSVMYRSVGNSDGWILESGENTNSGGTTNAPATTLNLGDDVGRKQYRDILSFATSSLPDNAVITSAKLTLRRQSITGGGNPFTAFQGLLIDVRNGFFGTAIALQPTDFQAAASKSVGPYIPAPVGTLYTINLPGTTYPYINKLAASGGVTQLRLRFKLDDNNNAVANFISFFSGNYATVTSRPTLVITYYVP